MQVERGSWRFAGKPGSVFFERLQYTMRGSIVLFSRCRTRVIHETCVVYSVSQLVHPVLAA